MIFSMSTAPTRNPKRYETLILKYIAEDMVRKRFIIAN